MRRAGSAKVEDHCGWLIIRYDWTYRLGVAPTRTPDGTASAGRGLEMEFEPARPADRLLQWREGEIEDVGLDQDDRVGVDLATAIDERGCQGGVRFLPALDGVRRKVDKEDSEVAELDQGSTLFRPRAPALPSTTPATSLKRESAVLTSSK